MNYKILDYLYRNKTSLNSENIAKAIISDFLRINKTSQSVYENFENYKIGYATITQS